MIMEVFVEKTELDFSFERLLQYKQNSQQFGQTKFNFTISAQTNSIFLPKTVPIETNMRV